jgi:hypothetical protein
MNAQAYSLDEAETYGKAIRPAHYIPATKAQR